MERRRRRGFSLVELVMVMVIMTIAAGIVAPNITTFMDIWAVEGKAREMASYLKEMRQRAIARQEWCGILLNTIDFVYEVRCSSDQGLIWSYLETIDLRPDDMALIVETPWSPTNEITFDEFGAVIKSGGDVTTVKVGIEKGSVKTSWVEVQDASGAVHIRDI